MCISEAIEKIYNHFDVSQKCKDFFFASENQERYSSYHISMYLIQDTHEGIAAHRNKGFSEDPLIPYIEFWGVMQAVFIQQDAISELYQSVTDCPLESTLLKKWQELRTLRNLCAGRPARKDRPKKQPLSRAFLGRGFGGYKDFKYEEWDAPDKIFNPNVNLEELLSEYEQEATEVLDLIHGHLKRKWPK